MTNPSDAIPRYYVQEVLTEHGVGWAIVDSQNDSVPLRLQYTIRGLAQWDCQLRNSPGLGPILLDDINTP